MGGGKDVDVGVARLAVGDTLETDFWRARLARALRANKSNSRIRLTNRKESALTHFAGTKRTGFVGEQRGDQKTGEYEQSHIPVFS